VNNASNIPGIDSTCGISASRRDHGLRTVELSCEPAASFRIPGNFQLPKRPAIRTASFTKGVLFPLFPLEEFRLGIPGVIDIKLEGGSHGVQARETLRVRRVAHHSAISHRASGSESPNADAAPGDEVAFQSLKHSLAFAVKAAVGFWS